MVGSTVNAAMNAAAVPSQQPTPAAAPADDMAAFKSKVEKLALMKDAGLISEEEFAQMKARLLAQIL